MRRRVEVTTDKACHEAAVSIAVTLKDGRRLEKRIERAIGSLERPLSDEQLNEKFLGQADSIIGKPACEALIEQAWQLANLDNVGDLAKASLPR